eukprot:682568-Amphidinium_carterae.1
MRSKVKKEENSPRSAKNRIKALKTQNNSLGNLVLVIAKEGKCASTDCELASSLPTLPYKDKVPVALLIIHRPQRMS